MVDRLVDALVAQPHAGVVWETPARMAADLLRAPPLLKQLGDSLTQPGVRVDPTRVTPRTTGDRTTVSLKQAVASDGARPSRCAICLTLKPAWHRSAISIRSSCDRKRALIERTASRSSGATNPTARPRRYVL